MDRITGFTRQLNGSHLVNLVILSVFLLVSVSTTKAQTPAAQVDEKSQKIIEHAIAALG